ncbi:hypothetical protein TUM4644_32230 [Shewanella colwelliana]|uniref:DUF2797 domain-containing protein n=1 Tax=Shewanella colwelliana TaxID=23 RepID=A0A1E5INI5_SHECO|nr:DUF2797 domain-containing protein [Shewanella colwelliana]OEG72055.1 hypothetical protein BEL05_03400 [Shewanella colwelliana]GIU32198.1 hypothetical protein TUM4644_32230 [Shewanella colwelliana]GIU39688.1 hypothetical protein TUM3794_15410 [Shewanella colwelliana]
MHNSPLIGTIKKMRASLDNNNQVQYQLPLGEQLIEMNPLIGQQVTLTHSGNIYCCNCNKKTKKSFSQGHCFNCMRKLASCDMCIMKPETCHFAEGTCREPQWGEENCFVPHYVYLSNTSGLKVGITRHTQLPTRWIDQGATQGLAILKVSSRQLSGLVEVELAKMINDKTNWRTMLKGNADPMDLVAQAAELLPQIESKIHELAMLHGEYAIEILKGDIQEIDYPVTQFPTKIASHNFDKEPVVTGKLEGIKGQYLIFDTGVINLRKFTAYEISVESQAS